MKTRIAGMIVATASAVTLMGAPAMAATHDGPWGWGGDEGYGWSGNSYNLLSQDPILSGDGILGFGGAGLGL